MHQSTDQKTVSLLIPCFNEEDSIGRLFAELEFHCTKVSSISWEVIFVNDGSRDKTEDILQEELDSSSWCSGKIINLSRNFGKEAALVCGLDQCSSQACIIMDADLQHPPKLIPAMISLWLDGFSIVSAKRKVSSSAGLDFSKVFSTLFYKVFRLFSRLDIVFDASDYRLVDRIVIDSIIHCREAVRFSKGFFAWAGFTNAQVDYTQPIRMHGASKWGNWSLWNYALDGIFNFSTIPLRVWSYVGLLVIIISFALGIRELLLILYLGSVLPGYASLFIAITFLGGVQLVGIGVIGEYVGRIFMETKSRPLYLVRSIYSK